jgi:stage II sporulation protein M
MKKQKPKEKPNKINNFQESWNFIKENKFYVYVAASIFLLFALIGYFISPPEIIESQILKMLAQLTSEFDGLNLMQTIFKIFFNNTWASFIALITGMLLCIFPLFTVIFNGYIVGYVANRAVAQEGILVLWRLFPHGIFELPAVIISIGLGFSLGVGIFMPNFKSRLKQSFKAFFLIILPLLLIAAVIEGLLVFFIK